MTKKTLSIGDVRVMGELPVVLSQGRPLEQGAPRAVDLAFVIDTTGSMSDKIEAVLRTCAEFVSSLASIGIDHRVAIVGFGDLTVPGDHVVATGFMREVSAVQQKLAAIPRYSGGGNQGESSLEALHAMMRLPFRQNAVRIAVLITDEPALVGPLTPEGVNDSLKAAEVIVYVVSPSLGYYRRLARDTGGIWLDIAEGADFSALLDMLRGLARKVSETADAVFRLGHGSVRRFLQKGDQP